ncbi:DNA replication/repair protein RecF [Leucobacter weissii]|uniref:DNA replication and repair protein RecF n=1 Tax=Leucobacter weissii TaxID=1983706 RepID=A0A939S9U4_9MICO|nr:DNA replication/repair protein RecF [Leucobacter weissii]MBO1901272.1 DNA replication/repair protein RecF [Leucobacter weissii]
MRVEHLSLTDFRNYGRADVELVAGHNLIIGRNGQGKTNLVEAIAYFSSLRSHRVSQESALIRMGQESAVLRMRVVANGRTGLLESQINRGAGNRAQVNRNAVKPRELTRWFSSVAFAPEDLTIVRGEPALRRRLLDEVLVMRNPSLAGILADYDRVVRQRNSLLKSARASGVRTAADATLGVWDDQLVELGSRIQFERRSLVSLLTRPVQEAYAALVGADHAPKLRLLESGEPEPSAARSTPSPSGADVSRETERADPAGDDSGLRSDGRGADDGVSRETLALRLRDTLSRLRHQEYDRAVTLAGPHRDDALFELNGLPVKGYASHGESWSFILSLRLAIAETLRVESIAGDPVIILDDVFAELDADRRSRLMSAVSGYEQVIVTAAVEEDVPSDHSWHRIRIAGGEVLDAH